MNYWYISERSRTFVFVDKESHTKAYPGFGRFDKQALILGRSCMRVGPDKPGQ